MSLTWFCLLFWRAWLTASDAPTEFESHGPVGIYQRPNIAKTVSPRYRPVRRRVLHMRTVGPQMCVQYKIRACYMYVRIRIQSHGNSALHRHTVIYPAEMKKGVFAKFDVGIRAVRRCSPPQTLRRLRDRRSRTKHQRKIA